MTERRDGYPVPQGVKPGLPTPRFPDNPDLQRFVEHITEIVDVFTGQRGQGDDMAVTWRTLRIASEQPTGEGSPDFIPEALVPERIFRAWPSFAEGPPIPVTTPSQDRTKGFVPTTGAPEGEDWTADFPHATPPLLPAVWVSERRPAGRNLYSKFGPPYLVTGRPAFPAIGESAIYDDRVSDGDVRDQPGQYRFEHAGTLRDLVDGTLRHIVFSYREMDGTKNEGWFRRWRLGDQVTIRVSTEFLIGWTITTIELDGEDYDIRVGVRFAGVILLPLEASQDLWNPTQEIEVGASRAGGDRTVAVLDVTSFNTVYVRSPTKPAALAKGPAAIPQGTFDNPPLGKGQLWANNGVYDGTDWTWAGWVQAFERNASPTVQIIDDDG
ncbi:MAG: hypothetical protein OXG44_00715, partial [Gammaproteobacteria bacterium]|nr:hypothetical protein [Gammaproteobacteria bacterium]